jgi:hypothetical protein
MSDLSFLGNATSYLTVPSSTDLNFGTEDFTIEWYQYQTDSNSFPRIFQIGTYGVGIITIGVSIEGGTLYYWRNDSFNVVTNLAPTQYKNQWVHFAIVRSSGITQIYMNGTSLLFNLADTFDYTSTDDLTIGNEAIKNNVSSFGGYMEYFVWYKGYAKYTANFVVPTEIPPVISSTMVLLTAAGSFGTLGSTVVNTNVGTGDPPTPPPPPPPPPPPTPTITIQRMFTSLYTNNAQVYYKSNSLASCGVGTVRNSRLKARRT